MWKYEIFELVLYRMKNRVVYFIYMKRNGQTSSCVVNLLSKNLVRREIEYADIVNFIKSSEFSKLKSRDLCSRLI